MSARGERAKPQLEVVEKELDLAPDIYEKARKEIAMIDWRRVHERGERAEEISLPDRSRCHRIMRQLFSFEKRS